MARLVSDKPEISLDIVEPSVERIETPASPMSPDVPEITAVRPELPEHITMAAIAQAEEPTGTDDRTADATSDTSKRLTPKSTPTAFSACDRLATIGHAGRKTAANTPKR